MTQPPQQPGWPDQPGAPRPYGPPPQGPPDYGQPAQGQPGYGQPQYGQPGYPQSAPGQHMPPTTGQPPPGQAFPGQPGQFGQQPFDSAQPGLPPGFRSVDAETPKVKRTGLIISLVVALVAVGVGIGAYFLFFHKSDQQQADEVVTGFAQAYTSLAHSMSPGDLAKVKTYLCTKDQQAVQAIYNNEKQTGGADSTFSLTASGTRTSGTTGSFSLTIRDKNSQPQSHQGSLVKQGDQWLVCNTLSP